MDWETASLTIASSATVLATSLAGGTPAATAAANPTIVSLTFDDGTISQYTLAWQRAIAASGMTQRGTRSGGTRSTT